MFWEEAWMLQTHKMNFNKRIKMSVRKSQDFLNKLNTFFEIKVVETYHSNLVKSI